jgi:uncharacterized protein YkwD
VIRRLPIFAIVALALALPAAASARGGGLARLIAPPSACPHQRDGGEPAATQELAMRCMTNYARRHAGRARLHRSTALDRSARHKAGDILRCDSFSHTACGRDFTYWIRRSGYISGGCWRAGENIAWGSGPYATVRSIFSAWIHSTGHRENILSRGFRDFGVGLRVGTLQGTHGAHVWVGHFGAHC